MIPVDNNVYVDLHGKRYIKTRSLGYSEYGSLRQDGTLSICGGNVGPEMGWKVIAPEQQTKEDRDFFETARKALPPTFSWMDEGVNIHVPALRPLRRHSGQLPTA